MLIHYYNKYLQLYQLYKISELSVQFLLFNKLLKYEKSEREKNPSIDFVTCKQINKSILNVHIMCTILKYIYYTNSIFRFNLFICLHVTKSIDEFFSLSLKVC